MTGKGESAPRFALPCRSKVWGRPERCIMVPPSGNKSAVALLGAVEYQGDRFAFDDA